MSNPQPSDQQPNFPPGPPQNNQGGQFPYQQQYGQAPYPPQQPYQQPPQYGYQQAPRQGRDGAQYVRQQQAHSLVKHLIFGALIAWVNVIYISVSPNHYWKF